MAHPSELTARAGETNHSGIVIHLLLCAAIAIGVATTMARSNRDAGEPLSPTLEAVLPRAGPGELLDVLVEGPTVSSATLQPHALDVLVGGPEVSAAVASPAAAK